MCPMGADYASKIGDAQERADRQASVNQPVVHHQVGEPEQAHAQPYAERDLAHDRWSRGTAPKQERDGQRRMQQAERVVGLQSPFAWLMMRAVHAPKPSVPDATVQERGPQVHEHRSNRGNRHPQERVGEGTIAHGTHHD
jgi:hypothetical protein